MRVLIAYGSRYGSTEEIASKLAGFLEEEGIESTVLDVKKNRRWQNRRWPNLEEYDGVIVGSGVKITKWMREPLEFLKRKKEELRGKKLALLVSCMSMLQDPDYAKEELLEKVIERTGVEADLYEAFGPLIDVGEDSRMGFLDKRIAQSVMIGLSKELGLELDMKGRNDLRDWDRIQDFAHSFSESLQG
jgi:menaquinone-dependent protoporphyrinogen oxidase